MIRLGEEISVQYLSALYGNFKRRKKIREEWYFDCTCRRCSDSTERGTFIRYTPEIRFSEPRFSEILNLMNKPQLPFSYFTLYPDSIY